MNHCGVVATVSGAARAESATAVTLSAALAAKIASQSAL